MLAADNCGRRADARRNGSALTPAIIAATATGVRIRIHLQPGASSSAVAGRYGDALRVRIAAPAVDGRANDALVHFLAERLDVPRRAITIVTGTTSRRKVVDIAGIDVATAARQLDIQDDPPG